MSQDLNRWQGIGRLGKDTEVRYMPDGTAVANLSIACGQQWKDKNTGEKQEKTEWVRLVAFGRLAEVCGEFLKKGKQIYAEGRLQTRKWQDKDGKDRWSTEVVLDQMQMLGSKDDGAGQARAENQVNAYAAAKGRASDKPATPADFDDDIPF